MIDAATSMALDFSRLSEQLGTGDTDDPVDDPLTALVQHAVDTLPRCEWASIVRVGPNKSPTTLAASAPLAARLDALQAELHCGPTVDAAGTASMVAATDLSLEERWAPFATAASAGSPARSVLAFRVGEQPHRVLTLYGSDTRAMAADVVHASALFATHARIHLRHVEAIRKTANLTEALHTSRVIGTAVGILMLSRKITADAAFDLLRDASQRLHVKLRDVAEDVSSTGELPPLPAPRRGVTTPPHLAG